jgi:hypothetical protein
MFPEINALLLFARLPPVTTTDEARLRIRLAFVTLTQMPLEYDCCPTRFLADNSLPVRAVDEVCRFLESNEWPEPVRLYQVLLISTVGPSESARIVACAVASLVRAVDTLFEKLVNLMAASRRADRATRCACQANEWGAYSPESLAFLEKVQKRLYGPLPVTALAALEDGTPVTY